MIYRSYPINFIKNILSEYSFSEYFKRYQFIKFFIITLIWGFLISLTLLAVSLKLFDFTFSRTYFSYVLYFWQSNIFLLIFTTIIFIIFWSNAFRGQFKYFVQYKHVPKELDLEIEETFKLINRFLSSLLYIFTVIIAIPVIQLSNTQLISILLPIIGFIITLVIKFLPTIIKRNKIDTLSESLSEYTFEGISYNSGSIGFSSNQVEKELEYYKSLGTPNPTSERVLGYLQGKEKGVFSGYKNIFKQIDKLLGSTNIYRNIIFHSRTTSVIAYAFDFIFKKYGENVEIIFDDAAYPSIIDLINKRKNIKKIDIQNELLDGYLDLDKYINSIKENIESAENDVIIFISHINFLTGYIFDVDKIINAINKDQRDKKIFFIIDGAQAVGNIKIEQSILDKSHFYAFCGHKWLLSKPTIGILYINRQLLTKNNYFTNEEINSFVTSVGAFNYHDYDINQYSGTVQVEPHISLSISLNDINRFDMGIIQTHNSYLKNHFIDNINKLTNKIIPIDYSQSDSIVTIKYEFAQELNIYLDRHYNISAFLFENNKHLLRFSFHYFMSINDVNKLLYGIIDFQNKLNKNDTQQWL